jgi:lactoylglutathione lyase
MHPAMALMGQLTSVHSRNSDTVSPQEGSMPMTSRFTAAYPISGEDLTALPVRSIGSAVEFYTNALGFAVVSHDDGTAVVQRDDVRLGLVWKPDHKPGEAGSCCFAVSDLDATREELLARGGSEVGVFGTNEWGGRKFRTFFVREHTDGYCYCFSQPV